MGFVFWGIIIAALVGMGKFLLSKIKGPYTVYYRQKRREFPWLEKWIETNGDPAKTEVGGKAYGTAAKCMLASFVGAWIIGSIFNKLFGLPFSFETLELNASIATVIVTLLVILACCATSTFIGLRFISDPSKSAKECPKCTCPKAWEEETVTVLDHYEKKTGTLTTTTDRAARDMSEAMFGTGEKKITTENITVYTYYYITMTDGKCANCGHTVHTEKQTVTEREDANAISHEAYQNTRSAKGD